MACALNSSIIRKNLFEYLCRIYPDKALFAEIRKTTGHSTTNLKGAAIGDGISFSVEDSLVELGLAEYENPKPEIKSAETLKATGWGFTNKDRITATYRQIVAKENSNTHTHTHTIINASPARRIPVTGKRVDAAKQR